MSVRKLMTTAAFCMASTGAAMADGHRIQVDVVTDSGKKHTLTSPDVYDNLEDCQRDRAFVILSQNPAELSHIDRFSYEYGLRGIQSEFTKGLIGGGRDLGRNIRPPRVNDKGPLDPNDISSITTISAPTCTI